MSSALDNPSTALHVLSFKASLPVLVAMFMPDCPTPVSVKWLMHRTGVKARKTINETLDYLEYLGVIACVMTANKGWWALTDKGKQLPLPFAGSLAAGTQPLLSPHRVTILDEESEASSQLPLLRFAQTAVGCPSAQSGSAIPAIVANSALDAGASPTVSKIYPPPTPLNNVVVVLNQSDSDQFCFEQQQQERPEVGKFYPPPSTGTFLREIGMGEPVPTQFCDFPLPVAFAYWWYALAQGMRSPQGYLRRRLEQGHTEPPDDYLQLAQLWLDLTDDERAELWEATIHSLRGGISLPDDFGHYVPFRPLLRLGWAWRQRDRDSDLVFVPDCLAWEDEEGDENDFAE